MNFTSEPAHDPTCDRKAPEGQYCCARQSDLDRERMAEFARGAKELNQMEQKRRERAPEIAPLPPGPAVSGKPALGAAEISAILKACRASQVAVLKFGDLYVRFRDSDPEPARKRGKPPVGPVVEDADASPVAAMPESQDGLEPAAQDTLERDEIRVKEQMLEELPITDPLAYERWLASGDAVPLKNEDTDA